MPERYSVKTREIIKILEENKITNVGKNTPYGDIVDKEDWWERHKSYIEHRKIYPYGKPPKIKDET